MLVLCTYERGKFIETVKKKFPCKDLQSIHEHRQFVLARENHIKIARAERLEYNFAKTLIMHYTRLFSAAATAAPATDW